MSNINITSSKHYFNIGLPMYREDLTCRDEMGIECKNDEISKTDDHVDIAITRAALWEYFEWSEPESITKKRIFIERDDGSANLDLKMWKHENVKIRNLKISISYSVIISISSYPMSFKNRPDEWFRNSEDNRATFFDKTSGVKWISHDAGVRLKENQFDEYFIRIFHQNICLL